MKPIIFITCIATIMVSVLPRLASDISGTHFNPSMPAQLRPSVQCIGSSELERNLDTLRSHFAGDELFNVETSLRSSAGRSPECREEVIQSLMAAMRKSNSGPTRNSERYCLWRNGASLLAELQATEALDLLVANLDVTDGLSVSLSHFPAVDAVTRIGESALPKLQVVLNKNSNQYMRKFAVYCIASIGGPEARTILEKSLSGETDPCVNKFIRISLEMFANKIKPNHIQGKDGEWISAFYCLE